MKSLQVLALVTLFLHISSNLAFAGGGAVIPNTDSSPAQTQTGNTPVAVQASQTSGLINNGNGVTNGINTSNPNQTSYSPAQGYTPITPLQSNSTGSSYFNSTTQFSSGVTNQCGISFAVGTNNQNGAAQPGYNASIVYNANPCTDTTAIVTSQQEGETKRTKMYVQANVVSTCVVQRAALVMQGKDPDLACRLPNLSTMESLLK